MLLFIEDVLSQFGFANKSFILFLVDNVKIKNSFCKATNTPQCSA